MNGTVRITCLGHRVVTVTGDIIVVLVVAVALVFDFTNGFHDTANAMATTIATGALKPKVAVGVAAILNFAGAFISITVAATVAKGIVDAGVVTTTVIFAGLVGAITWNLATWWFGIPSSSSHALIGGMIGAAVAGDRVLGGRGRGRALEGHRPGADRAGAGRRRRARRHGDRLPPDQELRRRAGRARLPLGAGRVVVDGRARARHQRRAEDDGRDLRSR